MDFDKLFVFALLLLIISSFLDEIITFFLENKYSSFLMETSPHHFLWKIFVMFLIIVIYKIFNKN